MKSFYQIYATDFPNISENATTANKTFAKGLINDTQRIVLGSANWPFLEVANTDRATVNGQQAYELPAKIRKITTLTVTVGTRIYRPKPVEDPDFWNHLLDLNPNESDVTQYYYVQGSQVLLYPTPATTGSTITIRGRRRWRDLSMDDYTTGTIVTATNGDETIAGGSTVWVTGTTENYIRVDLPAGDNMFYEIDSITSTTALELVKPYEGVSIATGTGTYKIGEFSVIPSEYHDLLLWRSLAIYFMKNEQEMTRSDRFWMMYDGGYEMGRARVPGGLLGQMLNMELGKVEGVFLESSEREGDDLGRFKIDSIQGESWN